MGIYIRGAMIASSIWWLLYAAASRTAADIPLAAASLDFKAFNDRFSDWVAIEPQTEAAETEINTPSQSN